MVSYLKVVMGESVPLSTMLGYPWTPAMRRVIVNNTESCIGALDVMVADGGYEKRELVFKASSCLFISSHTEAGIRRGSKHMKTRSTRVRQIW